jgi:hypothetical protein
MVFVVVFKVAVAATGVPAPVVVPLLAALLYAGPSKRTSAPVVPVKVPRLMIGMVPVLIFAGWAAISLPPVAITVLAKVCVLPAFAPTIDSVPPPIERAELALTTELGVLEAIE